MQASMPSRADEQRLVQASWNLAELSERYERLIRTFEPVNRHRRDGGTLSPADSFVVRTLLVHEYRRIVLRDPRLPTALLPADWAGGRAYALCQSLYAHVFAASEAHLQQVVGDDAEHWHPLDAAVTSRFGGVLAPPLLECGLVGKAAAGRAPRTRSGHAALSGVVSDTPSAARRRSHRLGR
jgi:DNA-binding transcriptional regulator PaaX